MTDSLITWFTTNLNGVVSKEMIVFIISMVPILELRGGLVAASLLKIPLFQAVGLCIAGNIIPVPFILAFITPIFNWMKKTRWLKPLPGTGAWTGSLIASLLDIKFKKALPAVILGIFMATIIMCIITYFIPWLVTNVF